MLSKIKLCVFFLFLTCLNPLLQAEEKVEISPAATAPFKKALIIILENEKYDQALAQPYLARLTKQGALLKNYHGVSHPAQPNYLALVGGNTFGVRNDHPVTLDEKNIVDLLEPHGKTWKVYAEGYPGKCFTGSRSHQYSKKHNPLISFKDIQDNPKRCENVVDASQFSEDLKNNKIPDFSMFIPNQLNSGHDSDVKYATKWLEKFLDPLLKDASFMHDTLVVVTFSQSDYMAKENKVYTVLLGAGIMPGAASDEHYDHYNLLRTIEDFFGLGTLGKNDAKAKSIAGIWQEPKEPAAKSN